MQTKVLLSIFLTAILFAGVSTSANAVDWTKKSNPFPGEGRENAVSFVIGNVAYLGTGYVYKNYSNVYYKDFWKYDSSSDTWTQIADFPGDARYEAVSFSANGKGYVGLGSSENKICNDFYEYNPGSDSWTKITNFPDARYGAVSFSINNIGYVGTGYDGTALKSDFYKYENGAWVAIASLPTSEARIYATAFVVGDLAYVAGGGHEPGVFGAFDTKYEYNPKTNTWSREGYNSVLSSNILLSYVSAGIPYIAVYDDLYRYNAEERFYEPLGDVFQLGDFFSKETFFVINDVPYMSLGSGGSFFSPTLNIDLWYDADAKKQTGIAAIKENIAVFPNPATESFVISGAFGANVSIFDLQGHIIYEQKNIGQTEIFYTAGWAKGVYLIRIQNGSNKTIHEVIIR